MLGIVSVGVQEGQLGVGHDVIVSAIQSVFGGADEQVPIVLPTLPPHREVEAGPAELETLVQLRARQHLLSDLPQQFDAVQGFCGPLLSDRLNIDGGIRGTWKGRQRASHFR